MQSFLFPEPFTQKLFRRRRFCPQKLLDTGALQRSFYTRNADAFTYQSFLYANAFAHKNFTQKLIKRRRFYTEKLLNTGAFLFAKRLSHTFFLTQELFCKQSETGERVKILLYREETLVFGGETPLYWFKAPLPKLFGHGSPSTNVCFSTGLLWLNFCLKKVETSFFFHLKIVRGFGCPSLQDWTVLKKNNGCGWQKYSKITKTAESGIEDKWCRKAFLTGKAEINNMWNAPGIYLSLLLYFYIFIFFSPSFLFPFFFFSRSLFSLSPSLFFFL